MSNILSGIWELLLIIFAVYLAIKVWRMSGKNRSDVRIARGEWTTTLAHWALFAFMPIYLITYLLWGPLTPDVNNPGNYPWTDPWNSLIPWQGLPVMNWLMWLVFIFGLVFWVAKLYVPMRVASVLLVVIALLGVDWSDPVSNLFDHSDSHVAAKDHPRTNVEVWNDLSCSELNQVHDRFLLHDDLVRWRQNSDDPVLNEQIDQLEKSIDDATAVAASSGTDGTLTVLNQYMHERDAGKCIPKIKVSKKSFVVTPLKGNKVRFQVLGDPDVLKMYTIQIKTNDLGLPDFLEEGHNDFGMPDNPDFYIKDITNFEYPYQRRGSYKVLLHIENSYNDHKDIWKRLSWDRNGSQVAAKPRPVSCTLGKEWYFRPDSDAPPNLVDNGLRAVQRARTDAEARKLARVVIDGAMRYKKAMAEAVAKILDESVDPSELAGPHGVCPNYEAQMQLAGLEDAADKMTAQGVDVPVQDDNSGSTGGSTSQSSGTQRSPQPKVTAKPSPSPTGEDDAGLSVLITDGETTRPKG